MTNVLLNLTAIVVDLLAYAAVTAMVIVFLWGKGKTT